MRFEHLKDIIIHAYETHFIFHSGAKEVCIKVPNLEARKIQEYLNDLLNKETY